MKYNQVLLVSSDDYIVFLCSKILKQEDFRFRFLPGYNEALDFLSKKFIGVIIIDASLTVIGHIGFFKYVSEMIHAPMMVIGCENTTQEKIEFLELGAECYMCQPFTRNELLAELRVLFRRVENSICNTATSTFTSNDFSIDIKRGEVMVKGQVIVMTKLEYEVLLELISHAGEVTRHKQILRKVWGPEYINEKRLLYLYIYYLRKKIESDYRKPEHIMTVPKVGYIFRRNKKV